MARTDMARDPVNELYDRGCDLVEAASAIRHAAAAAEAGPAVPALMGCIEAALDELGGASAAIEALAGHGAEPRTGAHGTQRLERSRDNMRRGVKNLAQGLWEARDLAAAARALTVRALDRAGATRS